MQNHTEHNHNDAIIKTTTQTFRKICTSHFIERVRKGYSRFYCERKLETEQRLQHIDLPSPPDIAVCRSRSPGLLQLLVSKLTDFLSSPSYIIFQSPAQYLWNGMFDCHPAEITVMQLHRSLSSGASVYESIIGFYLVPYCQRSQPTRFLPITAIGMCHFRCLWNGMFGQVESQYTTIAILANTPNQAETLLHSLE